MARGPKKHMKRIATPGHWMLDKASGIWAPRPSSGPHKLRECVPLVLILRNRMKLALNYREANMMCQQRLVKMDGKARTDVTFPCGFMDVLSLDKLNQHYRLLYDTKGRFVLRSIRAEEASYKLCRVQKLIKGPKGVNFVVTHDGRTIRFPDPSIKVNDSVQVELATGKILKVVKFQPGNLCMMSGGKNVGRVGKLMHREKHPGSFEIIHLKDDAGHEFATRIANVMVIGEKDKPFISLPKGDGIKLSIMDDRAKRMGLAA